MEEELVKLREALQGHNEVMRRLHEGQGNTNTQNMSIDVGSKALWIAVWICTICCVITLTAVIDIRSTEIENARKLEADADRLSILLQWAPNLRDEVNREMEKRKIK